jgi:hypothetical protein
MPTRDLHDLPIKPTRVAQNRADPKQGEGPFVGLVSKRDAEQVQLNGLAWNGDHQGIVDYEASTARYEHADFREQGNRAGRGARGGNITVDRGSLPGVVSSGNRSGE